MEYQSCCPIKLARDITNNKNVAQINYRNDLFNISLISAGYNQKSQVENSLFSISTAFCDFKAESYSKHFNLELAPKIATIPINLQLFYHSNGDVQALSAKTDYSFTNLLFENNRTKLINEIKGKVDTKARNYDTEMILKGINNKINATISSNLKIRNNFNNNFFKFGLTLGKPIFTIGFAYSTKHKSFSLNDFELACKFDNNLIQNHTKVSTSKFRTIFDYNNNPYSISLAYETKNKNMFGYLKFDYLQNNKSFQYTIDSCKRSKFQFTLPLSENNTITLGSTISKTPIISISIGIDEA